jgi:hypothetical protein
MLRQENLASVLLRPRRTRVSSQVPSAPVVEPRSLQVIAPALTTDPGYVTVTKSPSWILRGCRLRSEGSHDALT